MNSDVTSRSGDVQYRRFAANEVVAAAHSSTIQVIPKVMRNTGAHSGSQAAVAVTARDVVRTAILTQRRWHIKKMRPRV